MPAVIDSMMYVGATPWHKEGVKLDSPPNCQEALVASGLNWEVVKRPTYYSDPTNDEELFNGFGSKPTGHYVTMRTDTGQVLGNVSQKYEVLQNSEAFMPFEALLDHGYELETAGAIELGRKVWILAKAPDSHMVGDEQVDPYILCYTSHDGSSGNNIRPTMIRVVCKNTLDLSLSKTADYQYNLRHTSNIKQNVKDLTKNIRKCEGKMKEAVGVMNEMNEIELNEEELALYFEAVIPFLKHRHKESIPELKIFHRNTAKPVYEKLVQNFYNGRGNKGRTLWHAYNAVTEYYTHDKNYKDWVKSTQFGAAYDYKVKALKVATAMTDYNKNYLMNDAKLIDKMYNA